MTQHTGDTSDVVPRPCARPLGSNNNATHKDLPLSARWKLALHEVSSDQSSQEDKLQSSLENKSPNEDLLTLNNDEIALSFDNEMIQWDGTTIRGTPNSEQGAGCKAASHHEDSGSKTGTLTDEIRAETTWRREEHLKINENNVKDDNKSNEEELDPDRPSFFGPHN
ncbi:hypothetical protein EI94DRAFT_1816485 [Lactarius quietus]|nr:hypothetical protein EI94DRAFT_1816485 [Lactarius quietus]